MADSPFRHRGRRLRRVMGAGLRYGIRRGLGADPTGAAEALGAGWVQELDSMKGMAMKVGQILSYMDGAMPEGTRTALSALQHGVATALTPAQARSLVAERLGSPVEAIFERFDGEAIAAASIGQVHRARFEGQEVAVKLRYPGVAQAFEEDLRTMRRLARVAGLATSVDGQAIVDDLRQHLLEECDYGLEARRQASFEARWRGDSDVRIPAVYDKICADGVLSTGWMEGVDLVRFAGSAAGPARERIAAALLRFVWTHVFVDRVVHADPHPGNLLVTTDGALGILDFGCVRTFDPHFVACLRREVRALIAGDRMAFRSAVLESGLVAIERGFDWEQHWAMQAHTWRPYLQDGFTFAPGWLEQGQRFYGPTNPNLRKLVIPPEWTWLARVQYGVHAAAVRLRVSLSARDVLLRALDSLAPEATDASRLCS